MTKRPELNPGEHYAGRATPMTEEFLRHKPGMLDAWTHADYHDLIRHTRRLEKALKVAEEALQRTTTQLAMSVSVFAGDDLTRHEVMRDEGREVLTSASAALAQIEELRK